MDYSSFGLKDRIAIVTGASQGIGRAIAVGLAEAGAHLVLAKHPGGSMEEIENVRSEIEGLGAAGHHCPHRCVAARAIGGFNGGRKSQVRADRHPGK